jgi:hypothetical protein
MHDLQPRWRAHSTALLFARLYPVKPSPRIHADEVAIFFCGWHLAKLNAPTGTLKMDRSPLIKMYISPSLGFLPISISVLVSPLCPPARSGSPVASRSLVVRSLSFAPTHPLSFVLTPLPVGRHEVHPHCRFPCVSPSQRRCCTPYPPLRTGRSPLL